MIPQVWTRKPEAAREPEYTSPPFTTNRNKLPRAGSQGRALFTQRAHTQREHAQWRPKEPESKNVAEKTIVPHVQTRQDQTTGEKEKVDENHVRISTHEEVMEQLHEVTRQYLSCPDPIEAAARRQRVLHGDAHGQMEETAAAVIAAELKRAALAALEAASNCNPVTPPPLQNYVPQVISLPQNAEQLNPLENDEVGILEPVESDTNLRAPIISKERTKQICKTKISCRYS